MWYLLTRMLCFMLTWCHYSKESMCDVIPMGKSLLAWISSCKEVVGDVFLARNIVVDVA